MGPQILRELLRTFFAWTAKIRTLSPALGAPCTIPHIDSHQPPLTQLPALMRAAQSRGEVHPQAAEIAIRAISFGRLRVVDVMVPRKHICAISIDAPPQTISRILLEDGHSRLPVFDGTLDKIVGVLVAKDVLALAWEGALFVLQDLVQPPYFAPTTMNAADLLKELQRRRLHFAIVVDELGGTAGIITLEDLLEELVGEIYGEHDAEAAQRVHLEPDGAVTVQGEMPVRDANRELHLGLPESETFSTVGGLCVSLAGRIPEKGHTLACDNGTTLEVVDASPRSVRTVRLRRQLLSERRRLA